MAGPLGAYFGSTRIVQGAAGLGDDSEAPLMAFQDGLFSGHFPGPGIVPGGAYPGLLSSYQDGSLGDAPLQAFADGVVGGQPDDPTEGALVSFEDGIFERRHQLAYFSDPNVGGGPGTAPAGSGDGGAETPSDMDSHGGLLDASGGGSAMGPINSYQDGIFGGGRGAVCGLGDVKDEPQSDDEAPVMAYNEGVFGSRGERIMAGQLMSYHDGSLGALAVESSPSDVTAHSLDLGEPQTLSEVKALIAYSSGGYALSSEAQKTYTPEWYTSGIWEPSASSLWQFVASAVPAFSGKEVSGQAGAQTYPNGMAIGYLYSALAAPQANALGPDQAGKMFPTISAWFNSKGTNVLPPYLSITDKTKGQRAPEAAAPSISYGKMAMWGLGAAALLGAALVLTRKR